MAKQRHRIAAAVLAALLASLLLPASAFAAGNRIAAYDVRSVSIDATKRAILVGVELAPSVPLPAEVSVAVPKGGSIDWVGELLGGDPSQDPVAKYTTKPGAGYDIVTMTLTKARRGQAEVSFAAPAAGSGGTKVDLSFTPLEPADSAQLAIEVPSGSQVSAVKGDAKPTQASGSTFYARQFTAVKQAAPLAISLTYNGGTASPSAGGAQQVPQQAPQQAPATQGGGVQPASPMLVVAVLAVILLGTFVLLERVRPSGAPAHHDEHPPSSGSHKPAASGAKHKPAPKASSSRKPASG